MWCCFWIFNIKDSNLSGWDLYAEMKQWLVIEDHIGMVIVGGFLVIFYVTRWIWHGVWQ
jgi:hypothetical protein